MPAGGERCLGPAFSFSPEGRREHRSRPPPPSPGPRTRENTEYHAVGPRCCSSWLRHCPSPLLYHHYTAELCESAHRRRREETLPHWRDSSCAQPEECGTLMTPKSRESGRCLGRGGGGVFPFFFFHLFFFIPFYCLSTDHGRTRRRNSQAAMPCVDSGRRGCCGRRRRRRGQTKWARETGDGK